jgi:hypothetical protein
MEEGLVVTMILTPALLEVLEVEVPPLTVKLL